MYSIGIPLAEYFFQIQGVRRYDLEAQSFVGALGKLILTPEYFCSQTIKVCPQIYEPINLDEDVARILRGL